MPGRYCKRVTCATPLLVAVVVAWLPPTALAGDLDLNLNDDAARLNYAWPARNDQLELQAGWLHHQDRGEVGHFGLHLVDIASSGANPLTAGIGGRVVYVDSEPFIDPNVVTIPEDPPVFIDASGFGLAIGGFVRYSLKKYNRIGLGGHVYFAPDVTSFGDAEQFLEASVFVSYNALRNADVYLGARSIRVDFDSGVDITMDTGLHVGIRLSFE